MTTVEEYLASAPEPQLSTLRTVRDRLRALLPEATEEIAYGVPTFKVNGKGVAGFGFSKNHCSYLPMSGTVLATVADKLGGYQWSKGALKFPVEQPLSEEMLALLVQTRLAELP